MRTFADRLGKKVGLMTERAMLHYKLWSEVHPSQRDYSLLYFSIAYQTPLFWRSVDSPRFNHPNGWVVTSSGSIEISHGSRVIYLKGSRCLVGDYAPRDYRMTVRTAEADELIRDIDTVLYDWAVWMRTRVEEDVPAPLPGFMPI